MLILNLTYLAKHDLAGADGVSMMSSIHSLVRSFRYSVLLNPGYITCGQGGVLSLNWL